MNDKDWSISAVVPKTSRERWEISIGKRRRAITMPKEVSTQTIVRHSTTRATTWIAWTRFVKKRASTSQKELELQWAQVVVGAHPSVVRWPRLPKHLKRIRQSAKISTYLHNCHTALREESKSLMTAIMGLKVQCKCLHKLKLMKKMININISVYCNAITKMLLLRRSLVSIRSEALLIQSRA